MIAVNRRNYPGSTSVSDEELKVLDETDPACGSKFLRDRGLEIALLLVWIVEELKVPPANSEGGGIVPLGWSMGNIWSMSFLRFFGSYPEYVRTPLKPYLRTFILYGLCFQVL